MNRHSIVIHRINKSAKVRDGNPPNWLINNVSVKGDNAMTTYNYTNKRQKLARILILCGVLQGLEACSTHISMTDGLNVLIGENAHASFNDRARINKQYKIQHESLDREALQAKLDQEV